jgi:hypothetical protein
MVSLPDETEKSRINPIYKGETAIKDIKDISSAATGNVFAAGKVVARHSTGMAKGLAGGCGFLILIFVIILGCSYNSKAKPLEASALTGSSTETTACGITVDTLVTGVDMLPHDGSGKQINEGKMGNEQHLDNTTPVHYCGSDSGNCKSVVHTGFVPSHTTDQERWYMNARWVGWTLDGMSKTNNKGDSQARKAIRHAKVIVTLEEPGRPAKSIIASVEEFGPGAFKSTQDGIEFGSPPEVRKALGQSDANTGKPNDKKGLVKIAFAADQKSAKLGPCK